MIATVIVIVIAPVTDRTSWFDSAQAAGRLV